MIEEYITWNKKVHTFLETSVKAMTTNRNTNALISEIKYPQLKEIVSVAHSQPPFVDDQHPTEQFIKEEAQHIHRIDAKDRQPWNVAGGSSRGGHGGNHCECQGGEHGDVVGGLVRKRGLSQKYSSEKWKNLMEEEKTQIREARKKTKDGKRNVSLFTKYNLSKVTKMATSSMTESVITAMICKDKNAADDDKNEAESFVSARACTKKRSKS